MNNDPDARGDREGPSGERPTATLVPLRRTWVWILGGAGAALGILILLAWVWWDHKYPYGWSHSCSGILGTSLRLYAEEHDGWLPHGRGTPEASLSLLAQRDPPVATILRRKHLPQTVVDEALGRNGVLGPDSCGWHYVEGLREDDHPHIAVCWDKVTGLGHNGDRADGVEHEVVLLDGSHRFIMRRDWRAFAAEQKRFLADAMAQRDRDEPAIRWSDEATLGTNAHQSLRTAMP